MRIELPLYRQEKPKTCALACLRMVLAAFGTQVEESVLESQAQLETTGTPIDELERLARLYNLRAEIQETSVEDLRRLLAEGRLAMAYLDRAVFDLKPWQRPEHSLRRAVIHVVIPTRVTKASITFHDPLPPRSTRKSLRLFQRVHETLGSYSVVCSAAGPQT